MVELSQDKFFYVFPDEYCAFTQSVGRIEAEKLIKTVQYYKNRIVISHQQTEDWVQLLIITNNYDVSSLARQNNLNCLTVQDFAV